MGQAFCAASTKHNTHFLRTNVKCPAAAKEKQQ
jgi:hypothetical protein